jgi:hypothetical protein
VAEPTTPPAQPPAPAPSTPASTFGAGILPVLSFIGTGIGLIGFVIFFGGFITWTRFDAAGLPADQAVARIPRTDLIVTGASFLVPAVVASMGAVALSVVLWDLLIGNRRRSRREQAEIEQDQAAANLENLERLRTSVERRRDQAKADMERLQQEIDAAGPTSDARREKQDEYNKAEARRDDLVETLTDIDENRLPEARRTVTDAGRDLVNAPKPSAGERIVQVLVGAVPMLLVQLFVIREGLGGLSVGRQAVLGVVILATLALSVVVVSITRQFGWFAVSVFLGVGLLVAVSNYERTYSTTKAQPVGAVVGTTPFAGFFVAETPDEVYVGLPDAPGKKGRLKIGHETTALMRLDKKQLKGLRVGSQIRASDAYERAVRLALELCSRRKRATTCSKIGKRELRNIQGRLQARP